MTDILVPVLGKLIFSLAGGFFMFVAMKYFKEERYFSFGFYLSMFVISMGEIVMGLGG